MKENNKSLGLSQTLTGGLLRVLPKNHLSYFVGKLVHLPLPQFVAQPSVEWFAKQYNINMDEAEKPLSEYKTIGDLFTRNLKPGVRPIGAGVVHPVDAEITQIGKIQNSTLIQAKGKNYSLKEFLASPDKSELFEGGFYVTYYLCPTDYHKIHSPVSGEVSFASYIPGRLWPVNEWSVNSIESLFSINERVVTYIRTNKGTCALVMVGATNVGKMTVSYDQELVTNQLNTQRNIHKQYNPAKKTEKGEWLGTFHMGSTVVMLYPQGFLELPEQDLRGRVRLGETLGL